MLRSSGRKPHWFPTFAHEGIHRGGVEEIHPRFDHPTFLKLVVTQGRKLRHRGVVGPLSP